MVRLLPVGILSSVNNVPSELFVSLLLKSHIRGEDNQILTLLLLLLLLLLSLSLSLSLLQIPTCQQWSELVEVPLLGQALIHPQEF